MIELEALHHLSSTAPDLDAVLGSWRDVLGFEIIARPDLGVPGAWLRDHGVEARLAPPRGLAADPGQSSHPRNHVALRVQDLEPARRRLEAVGLDVLGAPGGVRQIFVLAAGPNVIEFIQPS
jgi:catechol 2,3-dioxygenase-like lactoylglutathione lyase family enzyme